MQVLGAIDRWLARCWLAYPQLARRLLDACALYLRHAPCATGQRSLLTFCTRSLLPALPLFADAVVSLSARPGVRMRCFQLGGAHQADILSEWLLLTGVWQPALTAYMLRSLLPGDTLVDVGANTGYFALLGAALVGSTGRVVAVEACPRTHERLLANLALNPAHRPVVTAVHAAAAGHVDCCALLLRGGANVWARTSDGLTPETAARGQGDEALARVIATYP